MALTDSYTLAIGRIPDLFQKIRDGQAPDQLTIQLLKDWGFASSNDRAFIPMLKSLGFLSPDGKPTSLYHEYRDHSRSTAVMTQALRNAYSDIFLIKAHPTDADKAILQGKFKSFHNQSDNVAGLMTKTFLALLKLADLSLQPSSPSTSEQSKKSNTDINKLEENSTGLQKGVGADLHYNIQIHLPATKDVEVYNAIFKSLRAHLFAQ